MATSQKSSCVAQPPHHDLYFKGVFYTFNHAKTCPDDAQIIPESSPKHAATSIKTHIKTYIIYIFNDFH